MVLKLPRSVRYALYTCFVAAACSCACSSETDEAEPEAPGSGAGGTGGTAATGNEGGDDGEGLGGSPSSGDGAEGGESSSGGNSSSSGGSDSRGGKGGDEGSGGSDSRGGSDSSGGSGGTDTGPDLAAIERGKALAEDIDVNCSGCHGIDYAGSPLYNAGNITPDIDTGIGDWSDDEIATAVTEAIGRDGEPLCATMEPYDFTDDQVSDLIAFLRSLPPIKKTLAGTCK